MKPKFITAFMDVAKRFAQLSTAKRLQVGAIVVKDNRIISIGYNGMPSGWENECEYRADWGLATAEEMFADEPPLRSKPEVLHAERNALDKLARGTEGGDGAVMFVTHAPCLECAKSVYGAGITELFYGEEYRSTDGLEFLKRCGIKTYKVVDENIIP